MKLTINLDGELLDRVVAITGASTKTEAIHFALREVDRRARLLAILREGLGAGPDELRSMFDVPPEAVPAQDDRDFSHLSRVAEAPAEP
jgi:Arc/MetJ family transcription regulator